MSYRCPRCHFISHNNHDEEARYCGNCHRFESELLCFRLYIAGDLMSEEWLGRGDDIVAVSEQQAAISTRAEAAGLDWVLEVYDPALNKAACLARRADLLNDPEPVKFDSSLADVLAHKLGYLP